MNSILNKKIFKRSRLRKKFLEAKSIESEKTYNKEKKLCLSLLKKVEREYQNKLNVKNVIDYGKIWNPLNTALSNKAKRKPESGDSKKM